MTVQTDVFLTRERQVSSRIEYWNKVANSLLGAIAIRPASTRFDGQFKRHRFGKMQLVQVQSTPVSVNGLQGACAPGLFLMVNRRGSCRLSQRGRETWLEPGELTMLHVGEPYRIECGQPHETMILHVPLAGEDRSWDEHIAVAHRTCESELLASFMQRLSAVEGMEREPAGLVRTTLDLLELSWPRPRRAAGRESAATWERRIRQHVNRHLDDPDMDASAIAAHYGISTRYVHTLFARMGTTASAYILESRLQRVAERLRCDPEVPIGEVAFATGFNDLSHFCRKFRKRFGLNARAFRAEAPTLPE